MMNMTVVRNFAVIVLPNGTMNLIIYSVMPVTRFTVDNPVEFLMSVVDDFNGRRRGQISFEYVNSVAFKVVIGGVAERLQRGNNFGCKFHDESLLAKIGRA